MNERKLTESEIMKALECCSTGLAEDCAECPHESNCLKVSLEGLALDLINRKNAEIERLEKAIEVQEIMLGNQDRAIKKAKAEAIKEFAERVKDLFPEEDKITRNVIDDLAKEMGVEL